MNGIVNHGMRGFNILSGETRENNVPDHVPMHTTKELLLAPYGTNHSVQGDTTRVRWDDAEVDALEYITSNILAKNPQCADRLMHHALEHIKATNNLHAIFHLKHVENSAKLRSGYEAVLKRRRERNNDANNDLNEYSTIGDVDEYVQ